MYRPRPFLSTSPARGTTCRQTPRRTAKGISIHVPREGDDGEPGDRCDHVFDFYPRPPRGGRRGRVQRLSPAAGYFYPRPPRGGRRCTRSRSPQKARYFYPRPPRGGRPAPILPAAKPFLFLSTSPARGTTSQDGQREAYRHISIHVPREGDDSRLGDLSIVTVTISIHVPREGDDVKGDVKLKAPCDFYPRPPRGGRRATASYQWMSATISIHVPREGDDPG